MLTRRGRGVLGLGLGVYLAAWAFGSKPLYPVATGLLLVVALAWLWVRLPNRPFQGRRGRGGPGAPPGGGGAAARQGARAAPGAPPGAAAGGGARGVPLATP